MISSCHLGMAMTYALNAQMPYYFADPTLVAAMGSCIVAIGNKIGVYKDTYKLSHSALNAKGLEVAGAI
jgi:hypothetical protein